LHALFTFHCNVRLGFGCRHVLRKHDEWVKRKKCVTLEVEGARQRSWIRKTWKEVVDKDVDDLHVKPSDAVDRSK